MRFSEETIDLILDIKEYSGGKLKNEFELSALIEFTINRGNGKTFDDIIFKAKFLKGMSKVMAGCTENDEKRVNLLEEYTTELKSLTELINTALSGTDQIIKDSFVQKYFELTPECFMNLNLFLEDLSVCKDYFNDRKFSS
jgi:hypothetical protein